MTSLRWIIPLSLLLALASYATQDEDAQSGAAFPIAPELNPPDSHKLPKPGERASIAEADHTHSLTKVTSVETALISTTEYFSRFLASYPEPKLITYTGTLDTGCGDITPNGYAYYCPADSTAYINSNFILEMPDEEALYQVIAHEIAHHVQYITHTHAGHATDEQIRFSEHEADCISGAWVGWVIENDNSPDVDDWVARINEKWTHYAWLDQQFGIHPSHGAAQHRQRQFMSGLTGGLHACNPRFAQHIID